MENPLVNGIEVLDNSATGTPAANDGVLQRRSVDGAGRPTGNPTTANTDFDWSTVRGAFRVNGTVYYGLPNGGLYARTLDSATGAVGAQRSVDLYDDPDTGQRIPFAIANLTGMFYDTATHRLYYTVFNDSRLYFRYFTPESEVVGSQTFTADAHGVDFGSVAGMTLAGGTILFGSKADGDLRSVGFEAGAVTGGTTVLSNDGTWKYRAIVAATGSTQPPANTSPTAAFAAPSCTDLSCTVDASGSSDPDGSVVSYSWSWVTAPRTAAG